MTKLQTLTFTGIGTLALVIGVLLAGGALSSAQEGTGTPTPAPTAAPTDEGNAATPAPTDEESESEDADEQSDQDEESGAEDTEDDDSAREGCGGGKHLIKEAAADVLGISEDDLRAALREGQTLAEIAEAQGMSVEDFSAALKANVTATLQERLNAGEITQEEYDEAIANLQEKLDDIINATPGGARFFGPRGDGPIGEGL